MKNKFLLTYVLLAAALLMSILPATAQEKFKQLGTKLRTPNVFRTASGAPGFQYWQMQADYNMQIFLDDDHQKINGTETITYHNKSPESLTYLWIQLDQNIRAKDSDTYKIRTGRFSDVMSIRALKGLTPEFDGGFKIEHVKDGSGNNLHYIVNKTMMRVDLPRKLMPGKAFVLNIKWWYNINDRMKIGGRSGYEYFKEDDNYLYTIAQFYPRMAVYNEVEGWQNKQFLGRGEFTLPFGNFNVSLTVPADHIVAATGVLQNASKVLTREQRSRFAKARSAKKPVLIVTEEEARAAEKSKSKNTKTWVYKAENVRDFGFASSRKFMWDAMGVPFKDHTALAMSYYPKEGNPLWEKYSTKVVAHTLRTYSKHTFDYPYPVAISIHTNNIGMEYPMICFNGGRPNPDGTYSERTKYGMISVIIHEVGHNFFPMIVNSDERQWTWMDEGLNSFLQYLTEQEWDRNYPSRRGPAPNVVDYMKGDKSYMSPIMTNSESVFQLGNNAYAKAETALNILRETIMGRKLFDYAFKAYAQRWMFKHPTPDDFFRTMEDASAVDLDWFWRGWFYSTDHVDLAIENVRWFKIDTKNPDTEKPREREEADNLKNYISKIRNKESIKMSMIEKDTSLTDHYNTYDPFAVTANDKKEYQRYLTSLTDDEKAELKAGRNYYEISFENKGGLIMPIILQFEYTDGSKEVRRIPAEIWRLKHDKVSKIFVTDKEIKQITLDPFLETADTDVNNNYWPEKKQPSRFELFKRGMQRRRR